MRDHQFTSRCGCGAGTAPAFRCTQAKRLTALRARARERDDRRDSDALVSLFCGCPSCLAARGLS